MSEERPWYKTTMPNTDWNEADAARFDSPPFAAHYKMGVDHPNYTPPLDPQQPTPEQIADAARLAADDIVNVLRLWPYSQAHPLPSLRALLDMLTPPAPKWTKDENEHETQEDQGAPLPVLQAEDDGRVVAPTGRGDPVMDVPVLPAQPARQASEDGNKYL